MVGAERFLADGQAAPQERFRPAALALGVVQQGQVVEAVGRARMVGTSAFSRMARPRRKSGSASACLPCW